MGGHRAAEDTSGAGWIGPSPLRGPLLGLLLEQERPLSAYRTSTLLMQRLPAWHVTHSAVANLLKRLVAEGYAQLDTETAHAYLATEKARSALEEWMRKPLSRQAVREELHARIASASPEHVALLYKAIDEYERECFDMLDDGGEVPTAVMAAGSWRSLTLQLTRHAADETLHANIRWSKTAKQWLRDWVAACHQDRVPRDRHESPVA